LKATAEKSRRRSWIRIRNPVVPVSGSGSEPNRHGSGTRACFIIYRLKVPSFDLFLRCKENPIYVFSEIKLRGLVPNFPIHVSVSDLYIPMMGPPNVFPPERSWEYINRSHVHECTNF
jgi:hypothetical protein